MLTKFRPNMLHNQIDRDMVVSTPGNDNVSILLCWKNEVIKSRFDKLGILHKYYITLFLKRKKVTKRIMLNFGQLVSFEKVMLEPSIETSRCMHRHEVRKETGQRKLFINLLIFLITNGILLDVGNTKKKLIP